MTDLAETVTDDAFLGGRVHVLQPESGFRAGLDSVLLAAAVPAQAGDKVFEAGVGPGVAALCLAARCSGVTVEGFEVQPDLVALAGRNAERNGLGARVHIEQGSIAAPCPPETVNRFDHAMANPPFFDPALATPPHDAGKARAHMAKAGELENWVRGLLARLKHKGTLTLVYPAAGLAALLEVLDGKAGDTTVFPLWPGGGRPAKRMIVGARKGSGAPLRLVPGLVLHEDGGFTQAAEAVLRHGEALTLG